MTNRSGDKGTKGETAVVRWARDNGFGHADRLTKTGNHDRGDVLLAPGLMVEVKNVATAAQRGPTPGDLAAWMRETETERVNGGHDLAFLVVKRAGTADVGRWWAFLPAHDLANLVIGSWAVIGVPGVHSAPVSLTVADLTALLRSAGWGDPLEDVA